MSWSSGVFVVRTPLHNCHCHCHVYMLFSPTPKITRLQRGSITCSADHRHTQTFDRPTD